MGIFLRHSYNVKPPRWGSSADVQYAIKVNAEKIYGVDPDSLVLAMPLFWGLPPLDYSGKNNHGTNHGATYKDGSLSFDGTNDYVNHGDILDMGTSDWTVEAWIKTNQGNVFSGIVGKHKAAGIVGRYGIYTTTSAPNKVRAIFDGDGGGAYVDSVSNINDNVLHYVSVVYDRDGSIILYFDGNYEAYTNISGLSAVDLQSILNFDIGIYRDASDNPANYFNGTIDKVRISNVARTADQIALFHDLPWTLYQPVSRPIYFFQAAEGISIPVVDHHLQQHWRA